jgi:hypothetical protein
VLVEHWDGTSWSVVSSSAFSGLGVSGVSADASNDVWAVGQHFIYHFDGKSWSLTNCRLLASGAQISSGLRRFPRLMSGR